MILNNLILKYAPSWKIAVVESDQMFDFDGESWYQSVRKADTSRSIMINAMNDWTHWLSEFNDRHGPEKIKNNAGSLKQS